MKQIPKVLIIFFTLISVFSYSLITSARLLPPDQEDKLMKANEITHEGLSMKMQEDDLFNLMGLEECYERDEDCMQRRMVAEAHLDYIYTQSHKPKKSP